MDSTSVVERTRKPPTIAKPKFIEEVWTFKENDGNNDKGLKSKGKEETKSITTTPQSAKLNIETRRRKRPNKRRSRKRLDFSSEDDLLSMTASDYEEEMPVFSVKPMNRRQSSLRSSNVGKCKSPPCDAIGPKTRSKRRDQLVLPGKVLNADFTVASSELMLKSNF